MPQLKDLNDPDNHRPWLYTDDSRTINQYPTADKPITSVANTAHPEFNARLAKWQTLLKEQGASAFPTSSDDFRNSAGPAADDEELTVFSQLFVDNGRRSSWKEPTVYSSQRIACDPRLEETAKICFDGAFDANGNFNNVFCTHIADFDGFDLDQVQNRNGLTYMISRSNISHIIRLIFHELF